MKLNETVIKSTIKKENKTQLFNQYLKDLSEEQKMKFWIKTLLTINNNLPEVIKSLDKIVEIQASSVSFMSDIYNTEKSTMSQIEKVIDLSERKNKLLNIYLMSKQVFTFVKPEQAIFLERKYLYEWTTEELASSYNVSTRTIFRLNEKLIDEIYKKMKLKNWSLKLIISQTKGESWINDNYRKIAKEYFNSTNFAHKIPDYNKSSSLE